MEVKVNVKYEEKQIELGDVVLINYDGKTYATFVSHITRGDYPFMLVNLNGSGVWSSAKTLQLLDKDLKNNDCDFNEYNYTIYKASEYLLGLTQK